MSLIAASLNIRVPLGTKREPSDNPIGTACVLLAIAAVGIAISLWVNPSVMDVMSIGA